MKIQLLTSSHLASLESSWRTKYLTENLTPGEIIFSRIEKNYAFFLPEIKIPEPAVLRYVLSDLIWNCKENNISLVLYSFSFHVVDTMKSSIQDGTLKTEEVDFWWVEMKDSERVYTTLRMK